MICTFTRDLLADKIYIFEHFSFDTRLIKRSIGCRRAGGTLKLFFQDIGKLVFTKSKLKRFLLPNLASTATYTSHPTIIRYDLFKSL